MADYPTRLDIFKAWAKAMEAGATVGKPNYGRTRNGPAKGPKRRKKRLKRRRLGPRRRKVQD